MCFLNNPEKYIDLYVEVVQLGILHQFFNRFMQSFIFTFSFQILRWTLDNVSSINERFTTEVESYDELNDQRKEFDDFYMEAMVCFLLFILNKKIHIA